MINIYLEDADGPEWAESGADGGAPGRPEPIADADAPSLTLEGK